MTAQQQSNDSLVAIEKEREALFGLLGGVPSKEAPQRTPDDGGSHITKEAMDRVVLDAQVHKLYLMDMEDSETIDEYLRIKNGIRYSIIKETSFEKVMEYTAEGAHTKEVRYKRIVEYTALDSALLLKGLIRETKLNLLPAEMGFLILRRYYPEEIGEDMVKEYKEGIAYIDPVDEVIHEAKKRKKAKSKKK